MGRKSRLFLGTAAILAAISLGGCAGKGQQGSVGQSRAGAYQEPEARLLTYTFENPEADTFAYDALNDGEKLWYRDINSALSHMETDRELSREGLKAGLSEEDVDRIFQCVLMDHPEYFYVEGYTYTKYTRLERLIRLEISGCYSCLLEEAIEKQRQIEEGAEKFLKEIPKEASDYEKIKGIYEAIILQTEYDQEAPDNQNLYSVLAGGRSVCQGYAKAFQYLLNRLGIPCTTVFGEVFSGEGHAWNLVKADGEYYYVDPTWGDTSYQAEDGAETLNPPDINYEYLCVSTDQLLKTHVLNSVVPLPECTHMEDNYYVREGAYITSDAEQALETFFAKAEAKQQKTVTLKCASEEIYHALKEKLIEEQKIFEYLPSFGGRMAYTANEGQLSLTFWEAQSEQ